MHTAQVTACTMAFVVAIVTCQGWELLRTVVHVRTEPQWILAICMRILFGIKKQVRAKFQSSRCEDQ